MKKALALLFLLCFCTVSITFGQGPQRDTSVIDYRDQAEYTLGEITVDGAKYSDPKAIIALTGLAVDKRIRIPGPEIADAIRKLWRIKLFTDVEILLNKTIGDVAFLTIRVEERPRLSRFSYTGIKKGLHKDLNGKIQRFATRGGIVTEGVKVNCENAISDFFIEKGYLDVEVEAREVKDSILDNSVQLVFDIDTRKRVKIKEINVIGNEEVSDKKVRKLMKNTKQKAAIFKASKLIAEDFEEDKRSVIGYYNTIGYRDAQIVKDSAYRDGNNMVLDITVEEGGQYYFRNITFKGNSIYTSEGLEEVLGIEKGDIYDETLLETRLRFSPDGRDVSSLYLDNGYLFFQLNPVETSIVGDSIDLEIRISEGPQATIDKVVIKGNDRTHDHVVRRELRTKPGEKFSRADIIRSQREILALGYFSQENLEINTPVNPSRGTVDIEYIVEERPSDQLELSAGWGGQGRGVIGTLGVTFNNFSLRNLTNLKTWSPLPQGDGQRLSLRAQTNGRFYQSYNVSFTEPWLGGKKPNSFTVGAFHTRSTNGIDRNSEGFSRLSISGLSLGLGVRLKVPDDFFVSSTTFSFQNIDIINWQGFTLDNGQTLFDGKYRNLSINQTISRNSIDSPIFPTGGSRFTLSIQFTPPYSLLRPNVNYAELPPDERFQWVEYHKWKFNAEWYTQVFNKFVVKLSAKLGFLGSYNDEIGISPFERFELGGDGISNFFGIEGKDIISLRGYEVSDLPANEPGGAVIYDKFTVELRYPLSLNPSATIYLLGFAEGGNVWNSFREYNPLDMRRSAGFGLRVFLPMFGTLGFDYGFGFDKPNIAPGAKAGEYGRFSIILGFEPE
ncbi:MAG: outer membrane protein assembly factor BamA [Bacteroidota bacterium]